MNGRTDKHARLVPLTAGPLTVDAVSRHDHHRDTASPARRRSPATSARHDRQRRLRSRECRGRHSLVRESGGSLPPASRWRFPRVCDAGPPPIWPGPLKFGITLPNTPATIDSDYRGELMVALVNLRRALAVTRGMRIAQVVVARVEPAEFRTVEKRPRDGTGGGRLRQHRLAGLRGWVWRLVYV